MFQIWQPSVHLAWIVYQPRLDEARLRTSANLTDVVLSERSGISSVETDMKQQMKKDFAIKALERDEQQQQKSVSRRRPRRPISTKDGRYPNLNEKREVLKNVLDRLDRRGIEKSCAALLRQCADARALSEGKRLHAHILRSKYGCNIFLGNHLINMYDRCGSPDDARGVFDGMPRRDVVTWNAMIAAYAHNGRGKNAIELFQRMKLEGVKPDKVTFVCILDACGSTAALLEGQSIHTSVVNGGFETDVVVGTALVNMYGKCGSPDHARSMFDKMPKRNVVSWNAMIAAYSQNGQAKEALEFFQEMYQEGIKPNKVTFICLLDACANRGVLAEAYRLHARLVDSGFETDMNILNALVNMYGKCGSPDDARTVFDMMSTRNVVSWNAMIAAYAQNGRCTDALQLFWRMELESVKRTKITFLCVFDACTSPAALVDGQRIHASIVDAGFDTDAVVGTSLITMYGKCGSLDCARSVFDKMPRRDVVSWNAMITAYSQNGCVTEALELFQGMELEGVKPDRITFICALDACANLAALAQGQSIHKSIVESALEMDVFVGNSLIHMYGMCGCPDEACNVFGMMAEQDLVTWNAMIAVYAQNGLTKETLKLFQRMEFKHVNPDKITFISILSACSHAGLLDDGFQYLVSMSRDYGITPILEHYMCLLDLIGRAGQLDEAEDLMKNMPFQLDAMAWRVLLGACRVHGEVDRGASAAKHLFKLDPKDAAPYVLLSNIYAASGSRMV